MIKLSVAYIFLRIFHVDKLVVVHVKIWMNYDVSLRLLEAYSWDIIVKIDLTWAADISLLQKS